MQDGAVVTFQCGYGTPGKLCSGMALLSEGRAHAAQPLTHDCRRDAGAWRYGSSPDAPAELTVPDQGRAIAPFKTAWAGTSRNAPSRFPAAKRRPRTITWL